MCIFPQLYILSAIVPVTYEQRNAWNVYCTTWADNFSFVVTLSSDWIEEQIRFTDVMFGFSINTSNELRTFMIHWEIYEERVAWTFEAVDRFRTAET